MFTTLFTTTVTTVCSYPVLSFLLLNDNTQGLCYSPFNPMVTDLVVYERPKTLVDRNVILCASILVFTVLVIIKMIFNRCKKKLQTPVLPAPAAFDANLAVVAVEASADSVAPLPMVVWQPNTSSDLELARQEQIKADIESAQNLIEIIRPSRDPGDGFAVMMVESVTYEGYANIYENAPVFPHRQTGAQALASSPRSQAASANSEAASVASTKDAAPAVLKVDAAPAASKVDAAPAALKVVAAPAPSHEVAAAVETFTEIVEVAASEAPTAPEVPATAQTPVVIKKEVAFEGVAAMAARFEQSTPPKTTQRPKLTPKQRAELWAKKQTPILCS
jgi:hypothetical protein